MALPQLHEARPALRGRAYFRCRGEAEAVPTFEPEVMTGNPNKKCGIRIFSLSAASQTATAGALAGQGGMLIAVASCEILKAVSACLPASGSRHLHERGTAAARGHGHVLWHHGGL